MMRCWYTVGLELEFFSVINWRLSSFTLAVLSSESFFLFFLFSVPAHHARWVGGNETKQIVIVLGPSKKRSQLSLNFELSTSKTVFGSASKEEYKSLQWKHFLLIKPERIQVFFWFKTKHLFKKRTKMLIYSVSLDTFLMIEHLHFTTHKLIFGFT